MGGNLGWLCQVWNDCSLKPLWLGRGLSFLPLLCFEFRLKHSFGVCLELWHRLGDPSWLDSKQLLQGPPCGILLLRSQDIQCCNDYGHFVQCTTTVQRRY